MEQPNEAQFECSESNPDEMSALTIRAAGQADVETLLVIYRDAVTDSAAVGPSPSTLRLQLRTAVAAQDARHVAVAEFAGEIVAWASIMPLSEEYPTAGLGEIRTHVARGSRDGRFEEALFWEAESIATERLYTSLNCYAPASTKIDCVCERFRYQLLGREHSRTIFAYDTGRLVVFNKILGGTPVRTVTR